MNARRLLIAAVTIFLWVDRLPAPILEPEGTPAPAAAPKAPRSQSASADTNRDSLRKFDGTWKGPFSQTYSTETQVSQNVLVIQDGGQRASLEGTLVRTPIKGWNDMPTEYSTTALTFRWRFVSKDLKLDGSNLRIRWEAPQLIDWSPKAFSPAQIEELKRKAAKESRVSVYTLRGNQLTREFDTQGGAIYTRVK
jgi:hypothetical protein